MIRIMMILWNPSDHHFHHPQPLHRIRTHIALPLCCVLCKCVSFSPSSSHVAFVTCNIFRQDRGGVGRDDVCVREPSSFERPRNPFFFLAWRNLCLAHFYAFSWCIENKSHPSPLWLGWWWWEGIAKIDKTMTDFCFSFVDFQLLKLKMHHLHCQAIKIICFVTQTTSSNPPPRSPLTFHE